VAPLTWESFRGVPLRMNDDSMLTMYARLEGRTVHQSSAVSFTLVPDRARQRTSVVSSPSCTSPTASKRP
jgi:hypothetical protein